MKLQITQENLHKALSSVGRVAAGRSTLPILSNILLQTKDGRLEVSATNLDIAITHRVGAKIATEGKTTAPARLTQDFVGSLPKGVIDISSKEDVISVKSDHYKSTINGANASDFPVSPQIESGTEWEVDAQEFKSAMQQVVGAASSDDTRPVLTGVYLYSENNTLFVVATDGYRLAERTLPVVGGEVRLLVPVSSMQEVLRIIGDTSGQVKVSHDEQQVQFVVGDVELITRLIEGSYPDYKRLIPDAFVTQATVSKSELMDITKVASLFARESAGSVRLEVSAGDKEVRVRSIASQIGENSSSASATATADGEITLNSRFVIDALNVIEGDDVVIGFNDKLAPSVFRGSAADNYLHVIMPLKS